ncbi:MAG: cation diffusion facilitator family transporter [Myxococcota bacterium]|nr:cation diffusion facilitator family transporter [Myxococcota bacterium]
MAGNSTTSVIVGISANSLVSIAKFIGFAVSGSGAMLSEAIHSVADTTNQALLLLGLKRSEREADETHPEGYGRDRFFWGLVSALGIFFLGAGVTLWHGVHALLHPVSSSHGWVTWAVLGFAFVLEGGALAVAVRALYAEAKTAGVTPLRYFKEGRDPTLIAILAEDAAAVLGLCLALGGIGLEALTGSPLWDAIATLSIGVLLAAVAIFLVRANRVFLLSRAVDSEVHDKIREVLRRHPAVSDVSALTGVVLTMGKYRVAADLDFDGAELARRVLSHKDMAAVRAGMESDEAAQAWLGVFAEEILQALAHEVDEIEAEIRAAVPGVTQVDLETDA